MQDNDAAGTDPSIVVEGSAKQPIPVAQHPQTQSNINENSTLPDVIMMNGMVVDQGAVSGITFMQPVEPNGAKLFYIFFSLTCKTYSF